jgi:hypothetical protein
MHTECLRRRVMGRSRVPERIEGPSPEAHIHVYTELIARLEREQATIEEEFWMNESCLVMEKYRRELEKWKNHISIKG